MTTPEVLTPGHRPPSPPRRRCIVSVDGVRCEEPPRYPNRNESSFCVTHDDAANPETQAWQRTMTTPKPASDREEMYVSMYTSVVTKWAALLEHYDLAEDVQPDEVIAAAERAARQTPDTSGLREAVHHYLDDHDEAYDPTNLEGKWCDGKCAGVRKVRDALAATERPLDVTTLVTDTATGDQWRVPTRAVEAIVAALDATKEAE